AKSLKVGTIISSHGLSRLLKPAPIVALLIFLTFAFPKSYETMDNFNYPSPTLIFLNISRNGLFVAYPVMYNISDPSVIFLKINYTLLLSGDIELNPGPPIQPNKSVQGSFHQGDIARFGATAGIQCSCNALVSIIYSRYKPVNVWEAFDLDVILTEGDKNFKKLGFTESPYVDQFPKIISLDEETFSLEISNFLGEFISNPHGIRLTLEP
ncbi:MAG: hypothetical protein AAF547_21960, partial [Actinomycetota bacterium]